MKSSDNAIAQTPSRGNKMAWMRPVMKTSKGPALGRNAPVHSRNVSEPPTKIKKAPCEPSKVTVRKINFDPKSYKPRITGRMKQKETSN